MPYKFLQLPKGVSPQRCLKQCPGINLTPDNSPQRVSIDTLRVGGYFETETCCLCAQTPCFNVLYREKLLFAIDATWEMRSSHLANSTTKKMETFIRFDSSSWTTSSYQQRTAFAIGES